MTLNLAGRCEVPAGLSTDRVLDAIRGLVERHEALRTHFVAAAEGVRQSVCGDGDLDVSICNLADAPTRDQADPSIEAACVAEQASLTGLPFRTDRELPIRASVVTAAGVPQAIVLAVSHMAVDGWSFKVVCDDLRLLLQDPDSLSPRALQPVDRAIYEATDGARQREQLALEHWQRALHDAPTFWLDRPEGELRSVWVQIHSPTLARVLLALAQRTRLTPTIMVQAAAALTLCLYHDEHEIAMRMIVSPRFRPENREFVGAFNQEAILALDVREETFIAFLKRAGAATITAYSRCEYDSQTLGEIAAEIFTERGIHATSACIFNDARVGTAIAAGNAEPISVPDPAEAEPGTVTELRLDQRTGVKFFLYFMELSDAATLRLATDPRFIAGRAFLLDLEQVLMLGAQPDATIGRITQAFRARRHDGEAP